MPRGHGRISSNVEKVASRGNRFLPRRYLDERSYKLFSEERQISALVLGNTEQRCIILTLVGQEFDAYCKLATILQSLEIPDKSNHCPSAALPESPPTIVFLINLQKEHRTNLSEDTCPPDSSSVCRHSGMKFMGQSRNRKKGTKSIKESANTSAPSSLTVDNSPGSPGESLSPISSDDFVSDISKVEQPLKRSTKKKGKKKGKNYKRSICKEDSIEGHCEQFICGRPAAETSTGCPPTCLNEQMLDNPSEKLSFPCAFLDEDITTQKDDCETSNCADYSRTMLSSTSHVDEMEESETLLSSSKGFDCQEFTSNSTSEMKITSSSIESPESLLSTVYANVESSSSKQGINCNKDYSNISLEMYNGNSVMGSFQNNGKTDSSKVCNNEITTRLPLKYEAGLDTLQNLNSDARNCDHSFHRTIVNLFGVDNGISNDSCTSDSFGAEGSVDADNSAERAQCSSQACNGDDFHPVLPGKRGRAARKLAVQTGRDNSFPVWQKVQKMDNLGCIKLKNVSAVSTKVDSTKNSTLRARSNASSGFTQKGKSSRHVYPYGVVHETSNSSEINAKKKHASLPNHANQYSRKGSHTLNFAGPSKIHVQQKEGSEVFLQANHGEHTIGGLCSPCNSNSPKQMVKSTENSDVCPLVQQQEVNEHNNKVASSESTCFTPCMAGEMTSSVANEEISSSIIRVGSSGLSPSLGIVCDANSNDFSISENIKYELSRMDTTDSQSKRSRAECSHTEYSEAGNNSGLVLQKWVPVVRKDVVLSHRGHAENLTASLTDESSNKVDRKSNEVEVRSDIQYLVPSAGIEMQCSSQSSDDADCSSSETGLLSNKLLCPSLTDGESALLTNSNFHSICELKDQQFSEIENDLDKIVRAVNDSYKLQSAMGAHLISSRPLAEFERFMHSAAPVISQRHHNRICTVCSWNQETDKSLCLHDNISLASLWQWYEEPGCYGLEVKAENNHKTKISHDSLVEFRAYFVPYLSAVQLFRGSGSSYVNSSGSVAGSCKVVKAPGSSFNLDLLPMSSVPLPKLHMEVNECISESTLSSINEISSQAVKNANLTDEELIFEYFEHAHPPQRRPLFEKVKELVNGDQSSNSPVYGDPLKLENLCLHELHPASWYAVAWYPIYRIPEGNFRAAFLTYHSLGHFIRQSASSNLASEFTHIVSPVVGLQSYNAKKECWFQPRVLNSMEAREEPVIYSPSKLVEERLKTLEHTASVMASATVRKGNARSKSNHPDYNHFFSRW